MAPEGWEHQEPELGFTLELCKQHPRLAFLEDAHIKIKGRYCLGSPGWSQNSLHALLCRFGSSGSGPPTRHVRGREEKPSPSAPTPARVQGAVGTGEQCCKLPPVAPPGLHSPMPRAVARALATQRAQRDFSVPADWGKRSPVPPPGTPKALGPNQHV